MSLEFQDTSGKSLKLVAVVTDMFLMSFLHMKLLNRMF